MTDGRFEAVNSIRPNNWDQRRLWCERPQFQKLDPEIRYDESCPYHDLKADGCLQPEYGLMHDGRPGITPAKLMERPSGNRMHMGGPLGKNVGMGGYLMPCDVACPRPAPAPKHAGKPWGTGGRIGVFSKPEYIASPSAPAAPASATPSRVPFSKTIKLGAPVPYLPDDRRPLHSANHWRLKSGKYNDRPLTAVLPPIPPKAEDPPKQRPPIHREPFRVDHGQKNPVHMPTPYHDGSIDARRGGPLFTYWPHSKRNAPIQTPWSTMIQTADPVQAYTGTGVIDK